MFGILFVDVFLCLGYHYISALYEYVRENQRVASLPVATMQKIHRMTGIILAIIITLIRGIQRFGKDFAVEAEDEVVFLEPDHSDKAKSIFSRGAREDMNAL